MKQLLLIALLALPLSAQAATSEKTAPTAKAAAPAVAATTPEIEAVSIFGRSCVETRGDVDKLDTLFAKLVKEGVAEALGDDDAEKATGHETDEAWAMQSPVSKQKLLITKDEDGSCNLFVHRASVQPMREEFKRLVVWHAVQLKSKLGAKTVTKAEGDVPLTLDYFEVLTQDKTKRPMLILSSTDKPKGDTQFLLTYKTIKSKIDAPK